jgi:hypothetical protein
VLAGLLGAMAWPGEGAHGGRSGEGHRASPRACGPQRAHSAAGAGGSWPLASAPNGCGLRPVDGR